MLKKALLIFPILISFLIGVYFSTDENDSLVRNEDSLVQLEKTKKVTQTEKKGTPHSGERTKKN